MQMRKTTMTTLMLLLIVAFALMAISSPVLGGWVDGFRVH